jgi:Holliday junction resolvase
MIRGAYEKPLIYSLQDHFRTRGFFTHRHAQLNIAWSNIISDIDLLAFNKKEVIAIEVKSKKDIFTRAFKQLEKIAPFVDKAYVATDDEVKANTFRKTNSNFGILYIDLTYNNIITKKGARLYKQIPSIEALCYLQKCCLQELACEFKVAPFQSKQYIALDIIQRANSVELKHKLKDIVVYKKILHTHIN